MITSTNPLSQRMGIGSSLGNFGGGNGGFMRQNNNINTQPIMPEPKPEVQEENLDDELEVPAFIRRKLK